MGVYLRVHLLSNCFHKLSYISAAFTLDTLVFLVLEPLKLSFARVRAVLSHEKIATCYNTDLSHGIYPGGRGDHRSALPTSTDWQDLIGVYYVALAVQMRDRRC